MVWAERALFDRRRDGLASRPARDVRVVHRSRREVAERHADLVVVDSECRLEYSEGPFQQFNGLLVTARGVEDCGEGRSVGSRVGMIGAQRGGTDAHRFARCRLAVSRPPGGVREATEVVKNGGHLGVSGPERGDKDLA